MPPSGNAAPPPLAVGVVNGVMTKWRAPDTATECELFPLGTVPITVCEVASTIARTGVSGHVAEPPPHDFPFAVHRLSARNQRLEVES
jgi:hypothetical protein